MTTPAQPIPTTPSSESEPSAEPATPQSAPSAPASGPQNGPDGFPAATPLAEMSAEQQVAYWKFHSRKHEDAARDLRSQYADYDTLRAKAAEADRLRQERETESEKAVREATKTARLAALQEVRPQLVAAEFRAASAGRIDAARLATLTEDIDMSRYLKSDGSVDLEKVAAKVDAWAPELDSTATEPPKRGVKPDPSQGSRGTKTTGADVGREMFEARRKRPANA